MGPSTIVRSELIGLGVEVVKATNPSLLGIRGKIVDETRNTLVIARGKRLKTVFKDQVTLNIMVKGKTIQINGKLLVNRPEDRVKRLRKL